MKSKKMVQIVAVGMLVGLAIHAQAPASAALQTGPGVQAPNDAKYQEFVTANCKNPPAPRVRGGRGGPGADNATGFAYADYTITEIPGVIAAGQKWKSIWKGTENNADGLVGLNDGSLLVAQNSNSDVMKIDKTGKVSVPYKDTNTGGALSMNKKGELFVVERGLPQSIWRLSPSRQLLANKYDGEPIDCDGGTLNDLTADSKGGVYFTKGGLYYANPKGVITRYGTLNGTNGIILSPDEKTLYVTGRIGAAAVVGPPGSAGGGLVSYDVRRDGSLINERQFAMVGADGGAVDAEGRVYSAGRGAAGPVIVVVGPDGKFLGDIPTPVFMSGGMTFGGADKKTFFAAADDARFDEIFVIPMIAHGYKGRPK